MKKQRKYKQVSLRTINAFLKQKGIDPAEFHKGSQKTAVKMNRKHKAKIEQMVTDGKVVLTYMRGGKYISRDQDKPFNFERPEILEKARKTREAALA